ncbi:2-C-methyl-D-erythritol 2,4-cyclodiphosphate synthase [Hippea maritima]|uniref:2-C-methyl-D-erythritol 2,4-cyclodiphosphate synthase n=1 Tax=Hippea maritima (strain ATCC 700847 / DSM 10411 / MH2) TaxID=760142 RepID=F2LVF6_HIPMA|nr:2-C-methyl-D-erythritol 2,4-cyclodiphosphate synthase [Hippea maritima]AEA33740.1 2-C-methyl-D-erythritol 2,4-cyclodiphosphate synthase [Hippea maritima DSM 10411]
MSFRIGFGFDVHRLVKGRPLILGGVNIEYDYGLLGHSDADCLTHAICDALIGALGAGDIGELFPDNDPQYKDIKSLFFLQRIREIIDEAGFEIGNIDATVVMQRPKLKQYKKAMTSNIAKALKIDESLINIKATTTELLGFEGRGEGVSSYAVAMLRGKNERIW